MKKKTSLLLITLLAFAGFTGFSNLGTINAQGTDVSGTISADTTWTVLGDPYIVVGNIIVTNGATLTINPGVVVKFDDYYSMYIEGNLTAVGLIVSRIQITSNKVALNPGDWDRIQVNSTGHAEVKYCDIKYANYALRFESSSNNNVWHNNIFFSYYGSYLENSSYNNISYNLISSSYFDGLSLDLSTNNTISNNTISSNLADGLYLYDSSNNTITNNNIAYNWDNGLSIELSTNNMISSNSVASNDLSGIHLEDSQRNILKGNEIGPDNYKGIELYQSSYNNLTGNNVTSNDRHGIYLNVSSWNNILEHNITDNRHGVYLKKASYNSIYRNIIQDNTDSIIMDLSSSNRVYHNDIIFNDFPTMDIPNNNIWNDTYPSGGNYWSEHSPMCDDDHDGADTPQTTGSPDGICDTAYELIGNAKDSYPLKDPVRLDQPIIFQGQIQINSPDPSDEIYTGSRIIVNGYVYDAQLGPIADITITVQLRDSSGYVLAQGGVITSHSGYFYVDLRTPANLSAGSYDVCAQTDYGNIPEECVNIFIEEGDKDIMLWPALLIPIIVIVVVMVVIILVLVLTRKKTEPQQYDPHSYRPPPPPPPPLPPPPVPPPPPPP